MKIALFNLSNFLRVIGSTEPYYVAKYLAERHELHVFIPRTPDADQLTLTPGATVHWVPIPRGVPTFVAYNLLVIFQMVGILRKCDIVYTYKGVVTPGVLMKLLWRKKWVCDFRSAPVEQDIEFRKITRRLSFFRWAIYRLGASFYKTFLRFSDLVVVISRDIANELVRSYHVRSERIHILPVGVDNRKFAKAGMRQNRDAEILTMAYVGSIAKHRGLDTVLQALGQIREGIPLKLVIAGNGAAEDIEWLKRLAQRLKVQEKIEWRGYIPHEEVPALLSECTVALSPLPDIAAYRVSVPAKVLEYLSAGKIVIASDIQAHRRLIEDRYNGLLFKAEDTNGLCDVLKMVHHSHESMKTIKHNAQESASKYDWNKLLPQLEGQLQRLNSS
jgi:glycosyltransferase involved in cell wall biosynthesis